MEGLHEFFGMAIKNARMDCGLTQEALAERAGISCRYLIAIENEGKIPKLPAVYRLIHSMHISADRIFYPFLLSVFPSLHPSFWHISPDRSEIRLRRVSSGMVRMAART